jgi:serine protease Do
MKHAISLCIILVCTFMGYHSIQAKTDCSESIPDLFNRTSVSVVQITGVTIDPYRINERFSTSMGSGFIFSQEGYILTNSHVVFGRGTIIVTLDDGQAIPATLVGVDPILDIAVLRISEVPNDLPVSKLGDSDTLRVGEEVFAIGNPLGLEQTLTHGLVSGIHRILPVSPMSLMLPMIQTDAAINPGNSGGPLLNRCGEVVGMNAANIMGAENIGFAIPINVAKQIIPQLIKNGRVIRPWVGIQGQLVNANDLQSLFNIKIVDGFLIEAIEPGSPAEKVGLRGGTLPIMIAGDEIMLGGDVVISANGRKFDNLNNYEEFVRSLKIGDKIQMQIYREGKKQNVELVPIARPILPSDLPPEDRRFLSPETDQGGLR